MNNLEVDQSDRIYLEANEAVDHALDATTSKANCEAWYEAIENVLLWQYPNEPDRVRNALDFFRDAIDERWD